MIKRHIYPSVAYYNLSCCYSYLKDLEISMKHLKKAIKLEPSYAEASKSDKDLINLRESKKYQKLIEKFGKSSK